MMRRSAAVAAVIGLGLCLIVGVLFTLTYASFAFGQRSAPAFAYFSAGMVVSVGLVVLIRRIAAYARR